MESRSFFGEITATTEGRTLTGYAAVFNAPARITERGRTFTEVIRPGAFRRAVESGGDILACFNHDPNRLLGRTSSGTLKLAEDAHGLRYEITLPESAADVRELVRRGDLRGSSFTFSPRPGGEVWTGDHRELTDVYLAELGPVVSPAYQTGPLALRAESVPDLTLLKYRLALAMKNAGSALHIASRTIHSIRG